MHLVVQPPVMTNYTYIAFSTRSSLPRICQLSRPWIHCICFRLASGINAPFVCRRTAARTPDASHDIAATRYIRNTADNVILHRQTSKALPLCNFMPL
jgi:hypothetical protein